MKLVNLTRHTVHTSFSGTLAPGQTSADGGKKRCRLEEALDEVVRVCGNNLGIRLNKREAELLNRLMVLDEKGSGFDINSLPPEIRDDPTGEKANDEAIRAAQQRRMDAATKANADAAHREAMINGEISDRKPRGVATIGDEGEEVTPDKLKSGFEKIMEENAKIAAGEKPSINEILDPVGVHMKRANTPAQDDPSDTIGKTPDPVEAASGRKDDATRNADAKHPDAKPAGRKNQMDEKAAEMAEKLSRLGPPPKKTEKPEKADRLNKSAKPEKPEKPAKGKKSVK